MKKSLWMNLVSLFAMFSLASPSFMQTRTHYDTHSAPMDEKISPWMNVISFFLAFKAIDRRVKAAVFI
jgi:hypothetical protein